VQKDLTIKKLGDGLDGNDTFLFRIQSNGVDAIGRVIDLTVSISGSGSVTLPDLYCGNYTVTELTGWSWAYENTEGQARTVTVTTEKDVESHEVIFTNRAKTPAEYKWLHGEGHRNNLFGKVN